MRKSPIRHSVKQHKRGGKVIQSFTRGSGSKSQRSRKVVGHDSDVVRGMNINVKSFREQKIKAFDNLTKKDIENIIPKNGRIKKDGMWRGDYFSDPAILYETKENMNGKILYHGTSRSRLEQILNQGIKTDYVGMYEIDKGSISLTTNKDFALNFAEIASEDDNSSPVILKIDVTGMDVWHQRHYDTWTKKHGEINEYRVYDLIPKKRISEVRNK